MLRQARRSRSIEHFNKTSLVLYFILFRRSQYSVLYTVFSINILICVYITLYSMIDIPDRPNGTFLIRPSESQPGFYALNVVCNALVYACLIERRQTPRVGYGFAATQCWFDSLEEFVGHYAVHSLKENNPELCTTLLYPVHYRGLASASGSGGAPAPQLPGGGDLGLMGEDSLLLLAGGALQNTQYNYEHLALQESLSSSSLVTDAAGVTGAAQQHQLPGSSDCSTSAGVGSVAPGTSGVQQGASGSTKPVGATMGGLLQQPDVHFASAASSTTGSALTSSHHHVSTTSSARAGVTSPPTDGDH